MPIAQVVDLFHEDAEPDFRALAEAGVVGVILKATQGASEVDSKFDCWYERAVMVFGPGCVHTYHMLDGSGPGEQMAHYLTVTQGKAGRWLDYELPSCTLAIAVAACHDLTQQQGWFPGMYGSDEGPLGVALLQGHFKGACPLWIARYGRQPAHQCDLWQWQAGENAVQMVAGQRYDASVYMGSRSCAAWMQSLCSPPVAQLATAIPDHDKGI